MAIGDVDIVSISFGEHEAKPPLIVDPDAVLIPPVTPQPFKAVAWQRRKILQRGRSLHPIEFQACSSLETGKNPHPLPGSEIAGSLVPVADVHEKP